ncbi:MAG: response regulator [Butyribacter sp.]|nr:response regulator [bacterium]MDY3854714.1 response regulator [Butyribacter sp.]
MSEVSMNGRANILIVDDVPANLVLLSEMIKELGYIPRPVVSVKQAQLAIEKKMPNLILLDISMPDITGFEYCTMLKADVKTRDIPIIFISALDSVDDKVRGFKLGAVDYISKPFEKEELTVRLATHLKLYQMQQELESYNHRLHKMVNDQIQMVTREQKNILRALASLIEAKGDESGTHISMIGANSRLLAMSLQLSPKYEKEITTSFIEEIELASQLHDLGFIAINDTILFKREELTAAEWEVLKTHAEIGAKQLEEIYEQGSKNDFMKMAIDIARYHHENWDGSGYPRGLSGTDIPLAARIVKILDCYDVLNRDRCYRNAFSLEESLEIMKRETGRQFDPEIMEIFSKVQKQMKCENN